MCCFCLEVLTVLYWHSEQSRGLWNLGAEMRSSSWSALRLQITCLSHHHKKPSSLLAVWLFLFPFPFRAYWCVWLCLASHSNSVPLVCKMSSRTGDIVSPKDWMSKAKSINDNKSHLNWMKDSVKEDRTDLVALWCFTCVLSWYTCSETP